MDEKKSAGSTSADHTRPVPVGFNLVTNAAGQRSAPFSGHGELSPPAVTGNVGDCVQPPTYALPWLSAATPLGKSPKSSRSEEHTSELQSLRHLVCRLL